MPFPQSVQWGHLGTRNPAQFATMSAAQFVGQSLFVDDNSPSLQDVWSDGQRWLARPSFSVPGLTPGVNASASTISMNTLLINSALAGGGVASITKPGVYLVNATLFIPSFTELRLEMGVEVMLANNSNTALVANRNAFTLGTPIGSAIAWFGGAPSFGARITRAGIGAQFPVGSFIGIMGLTSSRNDQAFQGVWQVTLSNGSNIIEFNLDAQPPAGGNSTAGGSFWPADVGVFISGYGTLDGNAAGQAFGPVVQFAGDPRSCLTWFRNVKGLGVTNVAIRRALSWGVASNNCVDVVVSKLRADTYRGPATFTTDSIHLAGGHRRVLIEGVQSRDSDNVVGLTIDKASTIVNSYSQFYAPGDTHSIVIRDTFVSDTALAAVVGIWGPTDYLHNSVVVDGVHGKAGGSVVALNPYTPTAMNGVTGGTLDIRNITALCNSSSVDLKGDGTWDTISIENLRNNTANGSVSPLIGIGQITSPQTIRQLRISRIFNPLGNGSGPRIGPAIDVGAANIDALDLVDIRGIQFGANVSLAAITGGAGTTLGSITLTNVSGISTASGSTGLVNVSGATPIGRISFNTALLTGVGGTGFMLTLGASASVGAAFFTASDHVGAAGLISAVGNIGRLVGANAQFDGAKITAAQPGDTFYNTNAAFGAPGVGLYARGAAAFTRIAA